MTPIDLVDLTVRGAELDRTMKTIERVLQRGWFVLGPEVDDFETKLAADIGVTDAIGVGSGTDALILGMRAMGIGPGDEVIVPNFTAFPTAAAVVELGATPVLVDVESVRPVLDLELTAAALTGRTRAVILVHLYGVVGDAAAFVNLLQPRGVALIEDCAQAQGARHADGRAVGSAGLFGILSFYPTKNLGALGDGGAVVTADSALAKEIRAWRSHGERGERYRHHLPARNSRLDDLHAAVLADRLADLPTALEKRRQLSDHYLQSLPAEVAYVSHRPNGAPHLAVIRTRDRAGLAAHLRGLRIGSGVHYPSPLSDQPALATVAHATPSPIARLWADSCLSLPLHPRLELADLDRVISAVAEWRTQ